jgi:hypothetical protein
MASTIHGDDAFSSRALRFTASCASCAIFLNFATWRLRPEGCGRAEQHAVQWTNS